ncbi:MAG: hypothetical protein OEZ10_03845 [Gammaproteobacteria bacterium]|nr:hypothetical protein [Gammaproteobacteria bacterium]
MLTSEPAKQIEIHLNESLEALDDAAEEDASIDDIAEAQRLSEYTLKLFEQTLADCNPANRRQLEHAFGLRITYLRSKLARLNRQYGARTASPDD